MKEWIRGAVGSPCRSDSLERLNRWVAKQVVSEAVGVPVNHPVSREMDEPVSQPKNQWVSQRVRQKVSCWVIHSQFTNTLTHWLTVPFIEVLPHLRACPPAHLHADSLLNNLLTHPLCHLISHTFTMLLNSSCTFLRFFLSFTYSLVLSPTRSFDNPIM